jgi:hypothetical protein
VRIRKQTGLSADYAIEKRKRSEIVFPISNEDYSPAMQGRNLSKRNDQDFSSSRYIGTPRNGYKYR